MRSAAKLAWETCGVASQGLGLPRQLGHVTSRQELKTLTPACRGSGSPEKAKLSCWSYELLFTAFECPGGCRDAQGDAGMPEGMQEGSPVPRRMQGCPGEPFPRAGIEAFPSKQTLCGVSISGTRCGSRAGSQEHLPGASSLCLVHIAMTAWRGQQPREVEQDTDDIAAASNSMAVPCQIARYSEA